MFCSKNIRRVMKTTAFFLAILTIRLLFLCSNRDFARQTAAQSSRRITLYADRGTIFDRSGQPITGRISEYVYILDPHTAHLEPACQSALPFPRDRIKEAFAAGQLLVQKTALPYPPYPGILMTEHPKRYEEEQIAAQLIGYAGENGHGVSGLEAVFDRVLFAGGKRADIQFEANAKGGMQVESRPLLNETPASASLTLTLDAQMQREAERCLNARQTKGCVLISDCKTGEILVMASSPTFSPAHPEASLHQEDSPFLNRALFAYDAGSIFKIVTTAAALEAGYDPHSMGYCGGYYDAGNQKIACANRYGHGWETLETAFKESCNPFFCALAVRLGPKKLLETAKRFGLGRYTQLAPGFCGVSGNLPGEQALQDRAALALFGFGQGSLQVTPLQMLSVMNTVANGGVQMPLQLILQVQEAGKKPFIPARLAGIPVLKRETADTLRQLMETAVAEGSGSLAASSLFSSCGKTGTAETGWMEDGSTKVHGWFVGFFPADRPAYSMVVFCEDGKSGALAAAPIFKELSEWIWKREQKKTP